MNEDRKGKGFANQQRIQFCSRKNPEQKIYHTILVERNGYIQSVFSGNYIP